MNVQVIMKDGRPEWAVLPYAEYEALLAALESLAVAPAPAASAVEAGSAPGAAAGAAVNVTRAAAVPPAQDGTAGGQFSPARLAQLRQQKGMELAALAQAVGISAHYLQQMEQGEREPSEPILRNIARALQSDQAALLE